MFFASFIAFYKTVLCVCRHYRGTNDAWNASIAGLIAGTTLAIDSNKQRRLMVALYLSTRMLHFVSRFVWRHAILPKIDPYSISPVASSVNLKDLVLKPDANSPLRRNHGQLRPILLKDFDSSSEESGLDSTDKITEKALTITNISENNPHLMIKCRERANTVRYIFRQSAAVFVMMLSSSQILYSFIVEPDTLAVIYFEYS